MKTAVDRGPDPGSGVEKGEEEEKGEVEEEQEEEVVVVVEAQKE